MKRTATRPERAGALLATATTFLFVTGCALAPSRDVVRDDADLPEVSAAKEVAHGQQLFYKHCASCHGDTGQGNGPMAGDLDTAPADLTLIAKKRGGVFPEIEIREMIDGRRRIRGHGPREMPVWGRHFSPAYAGGSGDEDEIVIRMRIQDMVDYLESIQVQ